MSRLPRQVLSCVAALGLTIAGVATCATSKDGTANAGGAAQGAGGGGDHAGGSTANAVGGTSSMAGPGGFAGAGGISTNCGDGKIEAPETCDGDDLDGKTCAHFGLSPGPLQCNATCQIVVSGCGSPENCNNGVDDDADGEIDCFDSECVSAAACIDSCAAPQAVVLPALDYKSTLGRPDSYGPSCATETASEFIFEVTPTASGTLGVRVSQWNGDFSVSVMSTCGDTSSELACAADTANPNFYESLQASVVGGTTYYVMVDATSPAESSDFDIQLFMVGGVESSCIDLLDGDVDGLLDCNDPDCQTSSICTNGSGALGDPCQHTGLCSSSQDDPICLPSYYGFSGGYCSEFCDLSGTDCPGDGLCFDYGIGSDGVCLDGCTTSAECRAGYACVDLGLATNVCYIAPESDCQNFEDDDFDQLTDCDDPDCKSTQTCTPGTTGYGEACTANNQCLSNSGDDPLCLLSPPFFFSNGYCSEFCNVGASDCGSGGVCSDWFFLDGSAGQCFKRCQTAGDCASGLSCVEYGFGKHCNL